MPDSPLKSRADPGHYDNVNGRARRRVLLTESLNDEVLQASNQRERKIKPMTGSPKR